MNIRIFSIITFSMVSIGCSSSKLDDTYVGTSDIHYRQLGETNFVSSLHYKKPDKNTCLQKGDHLDIRFDTQVFYSAFEGWAENLSEGSFLGIGDDRNDTNEIGVFLTIEELPRKSASTEAFISEKTETNSTKIQDRMIYSSFSRKSSHPLNMTNKLVYSSKYSGADLLLKIEVREFDKDNGEGVTEVIKLLSEEASKYTQIANPLIGDFLDDMGHAAKNGLYKDDVIAAYEVELVSCGSYSVDKQLYLAEGQLLFLRHSQKSDFQRKKNLVWDEEEHRIKGNKSNAFTSFWVYKRQ
ncbi:TPA: hypothetical protein ACVOYJ_004764 [Vibrio diabolicus]|uniref:SH3 domain-containing protein n=1 Tax=Vibrio chemaguriensis TaxID=2527672 RepID=A0ABX1I258_9VIBR|nr:hypothetical protein [Vibrio chemaguriensis]NKJ70279.1 hypothetical protein [Vibrio chemaguriensis]